MKSGIRKNRLLAYAHAYVNLSEDATATSHDDTYDL
jgi:hypothetical protein